jgi:ATP-dependent RNA helicase SUPV3L1/SUV3
VLMRRLRDKEELAAEIGGDGAIMVEDHYVGRLDGFHFTPDASGEGIHGRAARHAAARVLSRELADRADALVAAPDEAIVLSPNGRIVWAGSEIARLERGDNALKPRLQLNADEHLAPPERERVMKRLEIWLEMQIATKLKPLVGLSDPVGLSGLARGIAFRLVENFGTLRRDAIADELKALEQTERASLRQHGVRFGAFNVYVPALLKPAAADLLVGLWTLHSGRDHGIALDALPPRPQQGLTSVEADRRVPEPYWRVAGFHLAGTRAVRIDMLERLADLIRVRVAYRSGEQPAPSGATGDGGFRVVSDLMSVVGCSGEDFASILRSFGFKRERRKLAPEKDAIGPDAVPPLEAFEDVWRPSRRKEQSEPVARHHGKQAPGKVKRDGRKRPATQPTPRRKEQKVSSEHSPFAALADLKRSLALRRPDRG